MTLTILQAADLLGVSPFTIRTWINRGHLHPVKPGEHPLRLSEDDVIDCRYTMTSKARHTHLDAVWANIRAISGAFE